MRFIDRLSKRVLRHLIKVQTRRIAYLEGALVDARAKLKESEEVYVRAYVTKYWRGKTLETQLKESK